MYERNDNRETATENSHHNFSFHDIPTGRAGMGYRL